MLFYPRNPRNNTLWVIASHKLTTLKFSFFLSRPSNPRFTSLSFISRHPSLIRWMQVTRWSERAACHWLQYKVPYKVRSDETINSIRQKRAPGTSVYTERIPRRRAVRRRGGFACATTPSRPLGSFRIKEDKSDNPWTHTRYGKSGEPCFSRPLHPVSPRG